MANGKYKRLAVGLPIVAAATKNDCVVDGCGGPLKARGMCHKHWTRWRKHGDPLKGGAREPLPADCGVQGFSKPARSRWKNTDEALCGMHYLRKLHTGSTDNPRPDPPIDGLCVAPGCRIQARSKSSQYCERHYYQIRRNGSISTRTTNDGGAVVTPAHYPECQHCGGPSSGRKYCGSRCSARGNRGVALTADCKHCGDSFMPVEGAMCCSDPCQQEYKRKRERDYLQRRTQSDPAFVAALRMNGYRRRARKRDAFVEDVDRDVVMARDKWKCHLCGEKIPKKAKWPDGWFGTLDHVLPLSQGGLHSYANTKAAHLVCNCSKGDRANKLFGQLGLEFAGPKTAREASSRAGKASA